MVLNEATGSGDGGKLRPETDIGVSEPVEKRGSVVADGSVMTSAEEGSELDEETASKRNSGRTLQLQGRRRWANVGRTPLSHSGARRSWNRYWSRGDLRSRSTRPS